MIRQQTEIWHTNTQWAYFSSVAYSRCSYILQLLFMMFSLFFLAV